MRSAKQQTSVSIPAAADFLICVPSVFKEVSKEVLSSVSSLQTQHRQVPLSGRGKVRLARSLEKGPSAWTAAVLFTITSPDVLFTISSPDVLFTIFSPDVLFTITSPGVLFTTSSPDVLFTISSLDVLFTMSSPDVLFTVSSTDVFPYMQERCRVPAGWPDVSGVVASCLTLSHPVFLQTFSPQ